MKARDVLPSVAAKANLAPSVHNTQPARWVVADDNTILVLADESRHLPAADPQWRDMALSCGTAIEGTVMALADVGIAVRALEEAWESGDQIKPGFRLVARIETGGVAEPSALSAHVNQRFTWRSKFAPAPASTMQALSAWTADCEDVTLAHETSDIAMLAELGDEASMPFFRDRAFRSELVDWMRLSRGDPRYQTDGMNLDSLGIGALEGRAAKILLGTDLFEIADTLGLAKILTGEHAKSMTASAIVLFHRRHGESPVETGRAFYRFWLNLTRLGFSAWPLAALADNANAAETSCRHFSIAEDRRLINVLRIGIATGRPARSRLPASDLIVP